MTTNIEDKTPKALGYSPMLVLLKSGKIDGFFVAQDNLTFFKEPKAIQQFNLVAYPATGGTLYLQSGLHRSYGYATSEDFAYDCAHGLVQCKTAEGALTLGPTRKLTVGNHVYLYGSGLNSAPCFLSDSPHQSAEIQKILEKAYPGASTRIVENDKVASIDRLRPGMNPAHWKILLFEAPPLVRLWFRYLLGSVAMLLFCLVLNAFGYIGQAPGWIMLTAFLVCFSVFIGVARYTGFTQSAVKPAPPPARKRSKKS
jgi:hypothetical protein